MRNKSKYFWSIGIISFLMNKARSTPSRRVFRYWTPGTPNVPGVWKSKRNHKIFFDWLGNELGFKSPDDWYNISLQQIKENGGEKLISKYYQNSPPKAL